MNVFIIWSGARSGKAAEALREWLPMLINALDPWLSLADIDKGTRWGAELAANLETARAGIVCLTPSNVHADWLLFETGALAKTLKNTFVCPLLIGLEPTDISGPLAQFQFTRTTREDFLKLIRTLNTAMGQNALSDGHVEAVFNKWWPELESKLEALPPDEATEKTHRKDRELLEESIELLRSVARDQTELRSDLDAARAEATVRDLLQPGRTVELSTLMSNPFGAQGGAMSSAKNSPRNIKRGESPFRTPPPNPAERDDEG